MSTDIVMLQGTWNIVALEVQGVTLNENDFKGTQIIIEGNAFRTVSMGAAYGGTVQLEENRSPKTLDLLFLEGPHQGSISAGIYELHKDTWRICLAFAGWERPTDFVTTAGSGHALETLLRERPRT